jgi:ATP-binding cassette subfamily F protein 3
LIEGLNLQVGRHDRIGVIGPNGRGKTTLLSLLAGVLKPVEGQIRLHPKTEMAYFGQSNVERLDPEKTVEEELLSVHPEQSRGAVRGICGLMMFPGDDALKKVKVLSGGEKSRVLLGKLLVGPSNLLLLDEPTNHLDLQSTEGLMHALEDFKGATILVTHSEMILRRVATRLVVFDGGEVRLFEGGYQDFLEQVGWADERSRKPSPKPPGQKQRNRKELRRLRSEIISERSRSLKPLKAKIEEMEGAIVALEEEIKQGDELLCDAATGGAGESIPALVKRSQVVKAEIQGLSKKLEPLTRKLSQLQEGFAQRLEKLK